MTTTTHVEHAQVAALTATAQPAAPQGVAYAELPDKGLTPELTAALQRGADGVFDLLKDWHLINKDAKAGRRLWQIGRNLEGIFGCALRGDYTRASNGQAPASRITVEQVEEAIGLQASAWDTIGAEKIVEAVLRLVDTQAPAAGAVAGPVTTVPLRELGVELRKAPYCLGGPQLWALHRNGSLIRYLDQFENDFVDSALLAAAPTPAAQADSVLKDHQIAALVNELRDIAVEFQGTQQLRERIAQVVVPALKAQKADSVLEDAALLHYALADGGNQSMNWQVVYDDWNGEGYFIDALRAAYKQDAARKQGGTHDNH